MAGQLAAVCVPQFSDSVGVDLLDKAVRPVTALAETHAAVPSDTRCDGSPDLVFRPLTLPSSAHSPRPEEELPCPRPARPAVVGCVTSMQPVVFEATEDDNSETASPYGVAVPLITGGAVLGAVTFLRQDAPPPQR
ncbi:hypothetical protein BIV23_45110 [Streptomyces monashensis]|uniref:GAF domain-containing protein n=1 Tax=Streptomyces monashensis TaxID=1678012 RepID=A0A1S2NSW0_9ACTN|nr:hypothetical protein BIV23_45110 [Streptomyces monashensis]